MKLNADNKDPPNIAFNLSRTFLHQFRLAKKGPRMANFRIPWGDCEKCQKYDNTKLLKERKHPASAAEEFIIHENCLPKRAPRKEREGETKEDWRQVSYRDPPAGSRQAGSAERREAREKEHCQRASKRGIFTTPVFLGSAHNGVACFSFRVVLHFHRESPERGFVPHTNIAPRMPARIFQLAHSPQCLF